MAGLILMAMLVVMVVVLFVQLVRQKPLKKLLIIYVMILGSYHIMVSHKCGPNSADVKVMKPMAQKIADYIVANGIPESLKDIPDLPYEVEGCIKAQNNLEKCSFNIKNMKYSLELYEISTLYITTYNPITETGIHYKLRQDEKKWYFVESKKYNTRDDGICNPMRM